jgi:hypothetical protein
VAEKVPDLQSMGIPIFVNVAGHSIDDYVTVCRRLDPIEAIERAHRINPHLLTILRVPARRDVEQEVLRLSERGAEAIHQRQSCRRPGDRADTMKIRDRINADLIAAMKAQKPARLSVLRMMKAAVKNKEIDLRAQLQDAQVVQVLSTLIKQRKDSIEQFSAGGRLEMADKEAAEIKIIVHYLEECIVSRALPAD